MKARFSACRVLAPLLAVSAVPAQWQLAHTFPTPSLGFGGGTWKAIYDDSRRAVLMINGSGTFAYDGTNVTSVTAIGPSVQQACFAFDASRQRPVAFDTGTHQTWELVGSSWVLVPTAHAPQFSGGAMVYHAAAGQCVYYGGYTGGISSSSSGETWHYDGLDWSLRAVGRGRDGHTMYYDSVRGVAVAYGGRTGYNSTPVPELDTYDGTSWTAVGVPAFSRTGLLTFDPMHGRAIVLNTNTGDPPTGYFEVNLLSTVQRTDIGLPPTVSLFGPGSPALVAYDERRHRVVSIGPNFTNPPALDFGIWELTPEAGAMPVGAPCAGTGRIGAMLTTTTLPRLGQTLTVTMTGVQPGETALFAFGFSNEIDAAGALPRDLGPLGMTSCVQRTSIDLLTIAVANGASVAHGEPIPNVPSLVGLVAFAQGAHAALGANPAGALTTNGLALVLGN